MRELDWEGLQTVAAAPVRPVVVDVWDPCCPPCVALGPYFEELGEAYGDRLDFYKYNRAEDRRIMQGLSLRGVPTLLFYLPGGELMRRLTGDQEATREALRQGLEDLLARVAG